jgi:indole-3-glycerol phosphate synthase
MVGAPQEGRLGPILARKRREIARRRAHLGLFDPASSAGGADRRPAAIAALRRPEGSPPRVIAEIKYRSPSEGPIRPWRPGEGARLARGYVEGGASAVSVLCDRAGFGGSVSELRRVARAVQRPVLFKEFVLDELQLDLARSVGASLVLLLVRALEPARLAALVEECHARGLEPLVEAANEGEVERALETGARVIGVNARDLATFSVDARSAERAIQKIVSGRVAVYMSGVSSRDDLERVARTRADAVLVGSALMRAPQPGVRLADWLSGATESTT